MATCDTGGYLSEEQFDQIVNQLTDPPTQTRYSAYWNAWPSRYYSNSASSASSSWSSTACTSTYTTSTAVSYGDIVALGGDGTVVPARSISDSILGCATGSTMVNDDAMYFLNQGQVRMVEADQPYYSYRMTAPAPEPHPQPHVLPHEIEVNIEREFVTQHYVIKTRDPDGHQMRRQVSDEYLCDIASRVTPQDMQDRLHHMARHQQQEHQMACNERRREEYRRGAVQRERLRTDPSYMFLEEPQEMDMNVINEMQGQLRARERELRQQMNESIERMAGIGEYQMGIDRTAEERQQVARQQYIAWQRVQADAQRNDVEQESNAYAKMVERRKKAEERAQELLGQLIGGNELEVYKRTGKLFVKGNHGDYILQKDGFIKHLKGGRVLDICCHLKDKDKMPATDNVIAMKMRLENDEKTVLEMANTHRDQSREEYVQEEGGMPEVACM